jgi:PPOX class probable F420-dependent enzyme
MPRDMSAEEARAFMLEGTRTGKLAAFTRDGHPHVVPVWFVLDGDEVVFTTARDSVKGRHILRDGRVSLCVDDERPPFAYVHVSGRAEASEDLDQLLLWAMRIAERYMGRDRAEAYGRRNAVPGELLVRLRPERVIAKDDIAGW